MTTNSSDPKERREHHHVREVFEQCCALLAPIVAANANVKTVSNFGMSHVLMGHFPELSSAEINIVILTVEKMHSNGRLQAMVTKQG